MYKVSKPRELSGDVVLLRTIRQACQLIPTAPRKEVWPLAWTTQMYWTCVIHFYLTTGLVSTHTKPFGNNCHLLHIE